MKTSGKEDGVKEKKLIQLERNLFFIPFYSFTPFLKKEKELQKKALISIGAKSNTNGLDPAFLPGRMK